MFLNDANAKRSKLSGPTYVDAIIWSGMSAICPSLEHSFFHSTLIKWAKKIEAGKHDIDWRS